MEIKISEATNHQLNQLVADCEGIELVNGYYNRLKHGPKAKGKAGLVKFNPTTDWAIAGPIIEREGISLTLTSSGWCATRIESPAVCEEYAHAPLVAAMRCYVVSVLGDEAEGPDELT